MWRSWRRRLAFARRNLVWRSGWLLAFSVDEIQWRTWSQEQRCCHFDILFWTWKSKGSSIRPEISQNSLLPFFRHLHFPRIFQVNPAKEWIGESLSYHPLYTRTVFLDVSSEMARYRFPPIHLVSYSSNAVRLECPTCLITTFTKQS